MKALLATLLLLSATPAWAANADAPTKNVDKSNDAGNDTGNARTEQLNRAQVTPAPAPAQPTPPPAPPK